MIQMRWMVVKQVSTSAEYVVICFMLTCCSGVPSVIVDTPSGATPIYTPPSAMSGGGIGPPPGM